MWEILRNAEILKCTRAVTHSTVAGNVAAAGMQALCKF